MVFLSKLLQRIKVLLGFKSNKNEDVYSSDSEKLELPGVDRTINLSDPILMCIFSYYTYSTLVSVQNSDSTLAGPLFIKADPRFGPLFLAQICGRWRRLAISTQHLWSSIHVSSNHHPELLKQWLQRSGTHSLSLHLNCVYHPEEILQANEQNKFHPSEIYSYLSNRINMALSLAAAEVPRWRKLSLALDFQSAFAFMQMPLDHAIQLEEITIQMVERHADSLPPRILHFLNTSFDHLPALKRVSWETIGGWLRSPSQIYYIFESPLLWERLKEVQMKAGLTMSEAATFLGMCVNASYVAIDCITNDYMDNTELPPIALSRWKGDETITLPELRELSIGFGGASCDCTVILERFNLPFLHTLHIYNFRTNQKSCCRIEKLLNHVESAQQDMITERNHPIGTPSAGLQRLLIRDEGMPEGVIFRLVSMPRLQRVPVVNFYTRRSVKWEFNGGRLQNTDFLVKEVEYLEDSSRGKWIGWGEFPSSSLY